ncbi:hypothetical protein [Dongia sp.]|jgi:DNA-directed RNA polymerase|uniref:hypothetical protein n=1 Tax=Dongia sp. TaxID=1977262 RepID=UPI0035AD98EC
MSDKSVKLQVLEETLEAMLLDNEDISARAVVRRAPEIFKHASDITRHTERSDILARYRQRQDEMRIIMGKADKQSKANLSAQLLKKNNEIAELTRQRDLLIASHKAMLLAVGQVGGKKAWKAFFETYQEAVDELESMKAMPTAEITPLPTRPTKGKR